MGRPVSKKPRAWDAAVATAIMIAESARLDRPEKVDWRGRPAKRRRVGDVIRWKANNGAVDQIISDLHGLTPPPKPRKRK